MNGDSLADVAELQRVFREKGVSNDRPVVVYGGWSAANYWGEVRGPPDISTSTRLATSFKTGQF